MKRSNPIVMMLCGVMLLWALLSGGAPAARAGAGFMQTDNSDLNVLPKAVENVGINQHLNRAIPPDLVFRDSNGKRIHLGDDFDGTHPVVLVLAYYDCPMLCTVVLNDLTRTLKIVPLDIGKDFRVITVSFNPNEKPPLAHAKKAKYVNDYGRPGAAAGWQFLTGDAASIKQLTDAVGFRYHYDDKAKQYVHPTGVTILTPDGRISKYFFGINYQPMDLRLALVDASHSKIGSLADQIVLFCHQYDPSTGRYGWAVMGALRIGGALMILGMGSLLLVLARRDSARTRIPPPDPDVHVGPAFSQPTDGATD